MQGLRHSVFLLALAVGLGSVPAGAQAVSIPAGSYQLLASRSQLGILLRKAGWLGAFADNHVVHTGVMRGSATGEAGSWHGIVTAPTAELQVVDPNRSTQQRHEIWVTMEGPDQLDAEQFPEIVWRLNGLELTAAAPGVLLHGTFSIHGVTRTVAWPTHVAVENGVVHVWGSAQLLLTDYGIQPIHRALGAIKVKNQFELRWDTYWQRS
ncbi:MAG: YceI family protein [Acidobacteria bacterium]|nr:MAG: YceI family protein [Acidobacteriota bacterium]